MKYIDYKKNHKYKGILRLALILVLILILGILFFEVWTNYYNLIMRRPYIMKGNYFLAIVYMVIYYLSLIMLDGLRIDNMKISNIVFSEFLSTIITNIVSFVIIILPAAATASIPFEPMLILTGIDFIVVIVWSIISKTILSKVYPATPMLLISNADKLDAQKIKFNERKDIYNIVETISSDRPFNEIKDKIGKFRNVVIGDITAEVRNDIVKYCYQNDVNTYVLPKLSDIIIKWSRDIYSFDTPLFLSENDGITFENEIIKRVFDIVISVFVLILLSPLFILLALLIKIEDGGPVFYTQERVTKDEKLFNIIKFRSMKVDDDKSVRPTGVSDDRVTRMGKFMRGIHFDEFPQFINVLMGDMSVVGPRPERIEHVHIYQDRIEEFKYRHKVKAGITGLAQIYGKYNTSAYDKLKLDLIYIKNYTIVLDIELLVRTLKIFFMQENTEGFSEKQSKDITKNAKQ